MKKTYSAPEAQIIDLRALENIANGVVKESLGTGEAGDY
jgi:hypothetical protein